MAGAVILKSRINKIIESLMTKYSIVAPVRGNNNLLFKEIQDVSDIVLSDELTYKSPKEFLFPQVEELMSFDEDGEIIESSIPGPTIIFGVKPCDLEALKVMTAVFTKGEYVDTYFKRRLDNTILVGMECMSEKPGCFCSERGIEKQYSRECDIFLKDGKESFLVEVLSDRGKALLEEFPAGMLDGSITVSGAFDCPAGKTLEIDADETLLFSKIDWDRISEKCLGCGICTFICPTCHCFEFRDSSIEGRAVKYRCWDSCMYPKFTLHASGHNPRPTKKERFRQRIMHKYLYVKKNFGYTACTGCGRCIRSCPAGMNIRSVVSEIMEELS